MTNQVIPDAAVEAAAKVLYLEDHLWDEPWETAAVAVPYRTNARIALEAAAPHMLAAAWDAGHRTCRLDPDSIEFNPYRSQK